MTDLADFLLARIAEDEAVARAATQSRKWWDWPGRDGHTEAKVRAHEDPYVALNLTNGDAAHIARHDPTRVLAECEAKRRVVAFYLGSRDALGSMPDGPDPQQMLKRMVGEAINESHADALKPLALPYADHPDYRQEWAP